MTGPLRRAEIERLRATPGATLLLFLTDRCPVGCGHCSVSSTPDGPSVTDHRLLEEIVEGVAALPRIETVAISGGEPFAERRGLTAAVHGLARAGKSVVIFTSGHWARPAGSPEWIRDVLSRTATIVLGADSFHTAKLGTARLALAVEAVAAAGCHLIVQTLDEPGWVAELTRLVRSVLGPGWRDRAELHLTTPLSAGRGAGPIPPPAARAAAEFGPCSLLNSPTLRYDGTLTACCAEAVIMGAGPPALRRTVRTRADVAPALAALRGDPVLRVIGSVGPRPLLPLAEFSSLRESGFRTVCQPCWAAQDLASADPRTHELAGLVATLVSGPR